MRRPKVAWNLINRLAKYSSRRVVPCAESVFNLLRSCSMVFCVSDAPAVNEAGSSALGYQDESNESEYQKSTEVSKLER